MVDQVRMNLTVARVLRVFLEDVSQPRYGYELMQRTGFPSGKLYPVLARLERAKWLSKKLEAIDPAIEGRPPRRLYYITEDGIRAARYELAAISEELRPPSRTGTRLRPEGGPA
jgi:PadR family transcriptional regulator, regulatory protein PadR